MSHQEHGRDSNCGYHHQALAAAVDWLLGKVSFSGVLLRNDCTWSARTLIMTALFWAWSDERTLSERFKTARRVTIRAARLKTIPATSYQAFMKILRKWTTPLVALLTTLFRERMRQEFTRFFRVAGFIIFGVDGSRFELARTESNERAYAPSSARSGKKKRNRRKRPSDKGHTKKATGAQMWITTLWHLGTQLPWSWRLGPSDSSEREHLRQMISELPANSLLVADAGFTGYELWCLLLAAKCELIIRVGSNVRLLKKLGYVRECDGLVYFWPERAMQKSQPPLVLRLVVAKGGRYPVYLLTSVMEQKRLSEQQVVNIYARRWGLELFYRHLKQTFEKRKLRSHSADNARVEAEWSLLGLWAMALHAQHHLATQKIDPARLSIAGMLRAYRRPLREYKSRPDPDDDLYSLLDIALKDEYVRSAEKTSRDYPRKKKESVAGPPEIIRATKAQQRKARDIRSKLEKGLSA